MPRGFHLITREVVAALPELAQFEVGLLHVFIQHTSASLTINENADPDVPADLEASFAAIAPEDFPYRHTCEGPDDMPAHVKASLLGASLTIPVHHGCACARHLAGDLSLRAPPPRRPPAAGAHALGRGDRLANHDVDRSRSPLELWNPREKLDSPFHNSFILEDRDFARRSLPACCGVTGFHKSPNSRLGVIAPLCSKIEVTIHHGVHGGHGVGKSEH